MRSPDASYQGCLKMVQVNSLVAMDSIRNEVSREINEKLQKHVSQSTFNRFVQCRKIMSDNESGENA